MNNYKVKIFAVTEQGLSHPYYEELGAEAPTDDEFSKDCKVFMPDRIMGIVDYLKGQSVRRPIFWVKVVESTQKDNKNPKYKENDMGNDEFDMMMGDDNDGKAN